MISLNILQLFIKGHVFTQYGHCHSLIRAYILLKVLNYNDEAHILPQKPVVASKLKYITDIHQRSRVYKIWPLSQLNMSIYSA